MGPGTVVEVKEEDKGPAYQHPGNWGCGCILMAIAVGFLAQSADAIIRIIEAIKR